MVHQEPTAVRKPRWSDSKVDAVAAFVVFSALLLGMIHFVMGGVGS
jgi:hypothetical protein